MAHWRKNTYAHRKVDAYTQTQIEGYHLTSCTVPESLLPLYQYAMLQCLPDFCLLIKLWGNRSAFFNHACSPMPNIKPTGVQIPDDMKPCLCDAVMVMEEKLYP